MDFLARGYRPHPPLYRKQHSIIPISVWLNARWEKTITDTSPFFRKAEIISGGPLGQSHSYFVEALYEQEGNEKKIEFEDLWVNFQLSSRQSLLIGNYKPLQQLDPGRRLSISIPQFFTLGLEERNGHEPTWYPERTLRKFSTGKRSLAVSWQYQSITGRLASDGLYHVITIPFPSSLSIGLNRNTKDDAGFKFDSVPKGVLLETYYRKKLNSIGLHAFWGKNRWMLTGLGTYHTGSLYLTAGLGFDHTDGNPNRIRSLLDVEYLPTISNNTWRTGLGLRIEDATHDGNSTFYVPYFALSAPNLEGFTTLLQLEYLKEKNHDKLQVDLSLIF